MSSRIINSAIIFNKKDDCDYKPDYIIIDPFCDIETENIEHGAIILRQQVETIDISLFTSLSVNDMLFIDSSHISKIGSDVNYEILEILPVLNAGVLVHFHDIPMPYEYPKMLATDPKFRMFWNESYLLQAFLSCNNDYKVVLPVGYIQRMFFNEIRKMYSKGNDAALWWSASFWIKCVKEDD
jgi:hypothetical protein